MLRGLCNALTLASPNYGNTIGVVDTLVARQGYSCVISSDIWCDWLCYDASAHALSIVHNSMLSADPDRRLLVLLLARPVDLEILAADQAVAWLAMRPPNRFVKSALTLLSSALRFGASSIAVHTRSSIFAPASLSFVITPASSFIVVARASSRVVAYRYYSTSYVSVTWHISYTCLFLREGLQRLGGKVESY